MSAAPDRRPLRTVETPAGPFELLEGGIIFWTVTLDVVIDERLARQVEAVVKELASGDMVAIVGDARGLGFADRGARDVFAESQIEGRVATAAIVSSRIIRWLATQYVRQVGERRPIRIFNSEGEAIAWATEQVRLARRG